MKTTISARYVVAALLILILGGASSLFAYTIYLKDGSQLVAKSKYRVDGNRAIITLPSGTQTFLRLSEIDVPRTEEANTSNLGTAVMMEDTNATELSGPEIPQERKTTLGDLITSKRATARIPRGEEDPAQITDTVAEPVAPSVPRTEAGFADLSVLRRQPMTDTELASEVAQLYHNQGLEELNVYRGTQRDRILVDIITNSEASVFQALEVSSAILLQLQERHPEVLDGLELYFNTYRREPAGQFFLDRHRARLLASKAVDTPTFFLNYVEF